GAILGHPSLARRARTPPAAGATGFGVTGRPEAIEAGWRPAATGALAGEGLAPAEEELTGRRDRWLVPYVLAGLAAVAAVVLLLINVLPGSSPNRNRAGGRAGAPPKV